VLLVLIDDAGFGNPSTFAGPIETPNYTRRADGGLRDNRFHVTAVCSPTRSALLTGRNQHRVGFGLVAEYSGPFPGYNATIPRDCATLPRILQLKASAGLFLERSGMRGARASSVWLLRGVRRVALRRSRESNSAGQQ
jgi:hypothetical protein